MSGFDVGLTPSHLIRTSAAVAAATIAGPFETGARLGFGGRLMFWAAVIGTAGILFFVIWRAARAVLARMHWRKPPQTDLAPIIAAALFALPLPPIVAGMSRIAMGSDVRVDPLTVWLSATALALLIWLVQFALRLLAARKTASDESLNSTPAKGLPNIVLRARLRLIADVACIEAQDHYLAVTDMTGAKQLVLYRFADAVAELGDAGEQVHRRFWIAAHAVEHVERRGKRMQLVLTNGMRAPVSDTFLRAVRARGWTTVRAKAPNADPQADREITRPAEQTG
jgi:hypothetical protein